MVVYTIVSEMHGHTNIKHCLQFGIIGEVHHIVAQVQHIVAQVHHIVAQVHHIVPQMTAK